MVRDAPCLFCDAGAAGSSHGTFGGWEVPRYGRINRYDQGIELRY